jgi:MFS transporter, DHA1 family, inner membrane transport protein
MKQLIGVSGPLRTRIGLGFADSLAPTVRYNMYTELWGAIAYGIFFAAAIQFIPVVLRKMGASSELLALYTAQTYIGSILTSFSIVLMRRRRTKSFAYWCWLVARSLFLLCAIIYQVHWLLVMTAFFWLLEAFPTPAYTRIVQGIYPEGTRGKVMSVIRLGMVAAILAVTPLAGWALDHWGFQLLFPLAALAGIGSTLLFNRLQVDEGTLPPRQTRSMGNLLQIVAKNRNFAIHLLSFAIFGMGALLGYALYPVVQVDRLQLSYTQIGLLGTAQSIAWLLGFIFWGRALDLYGGPFVMRVNLLIGALIPATYIFASEGWMLLPAFIAQGIIAAGVDLGLINTCIQLAEPENVVEYAAIQATVVGIRGMIAPFIGVGLMALGVSETAIFVTGTALVLLSAVIATQVKIGLTPEEMRAKRQMLRFRWPIRFRFPRV